MIIFCYLLMCVIVGTTFLAIKAAALAGAPSFMSSGVETMMTLFRIKTLIGRGFL